MSNLPVYMEIVNSSKVLPLTGYEQKGFVFDQRIVENSLDPKQRSLTFVGGSEYNLQEGTKKDDWQSGVLFGIEYIESRLKNKKWVPVYKTGTYSVFWDIRNLLSEYSVVDCFKTSDEDNGVSTLTPLSNYVQSSFDIRIYRRDKTGVVKTYKKYVQKPMFLGEPSSTGREDVGDWPTPNWANISSREYHFVIDSDKIYLNETARFDIGYGSTLTQVTNTWEKLGRGSTEGGNLYSEFFPIEEGTETLVSVSGSTVTSWTRVASLDKSEPGDYHYVINNETGVITIGGASWEDKRVKQNTTDTQDEIYLYDLKDWPRKGVVLIGSEKIHFKFRDDYKIYGLTRGYDTTTPASHSGGDLVSIYQQGEGSSNDFYLKYRVTPRVDYEITEFDQRIARRNPDVNTRPIRNILSNKVTQISTKEVNIAKVNLSINKNLIGGNLFGPMFFGTDTALLTAQVLDSFDNPVPEQLTFIEILSGIGTLNGGGTVYSNQTNDIGEIYANYRSSFDKDLYQRAVSVRHDSGDTYIKINNVEAIDNLNEVWVFQVLKDDGIFGTTGDKKEAYNALYPAYIDVRVQFDDKYIKGKLVFIDPMGVHRVCEIIHAVPLEESPTVYGTRFYVKGVFNPAWFVGGLDCWLIERDGLVWDLNKRIGRRVILYEWSTLAEHPVTNSPGAYIPLHPDALVGDELLFSGRLLPIPDVLDPYFNLGGYDIISSQVVKFRARTRDPFSNRTLLSNIIRVKLDLPLFLTGVNRSGALPVPHGWKFITDSYNLGAGLGGANFITINPEATNINQFTLTGVI